MSVLPPGWSEVPLDAVAETRLGKMLSRKSKTGVGSRPYLRNKNVQWGHFDLDDVAEMDFTGEEFERFRLEPGDLLVCEGGEVGRAAIWRGAIGDCAYQKALHRVRTAPGVLPEYLLYLLMHYQTSGALERFVTGSTIAHLPQEDLRTIPVPLPPAAEQRRIVEAIEEQFSRIDAAEESLNRSARGTIQLRRQVVRSVSRLSGPGVRMLTFDEAFRTVGDDGRRVAASHYLPAGAISVVDQGEGEIGGYTDDLDLAYEGPLPVVIFGDHTRRVKYVDFPFAVGAQGVKILRPREGLHPRYAAFALDSVVLPDRGYGRHFALLRKVTLPVPPLDSQVALVGQLEAQTASLDRLKEQEEVARRRGDALRRAILREAFAGRLVPQVAGSDLSERVGA